MVLTRRDELATFTTMANKKLRNRELVGRTELARRLEMSATTVSNWARQGIIEPRYHKLGKGKGRRVYFDWHDVCRRLKIPS